MSYEPITTEAVSLFDRARKAVVGAITAAVASYTSAVSAALLTGADIKTAVVGSAIAAAAGALAGFGFVFRSAANKVPVESHPIDPSI